MSEMIRRVARAIKAEDMIRSREEDGEEPLSANELSAFLDHPNGSGLTDTWLTEIYRRRARAAIEAMRENGGAPSHAALESIRPFMGDQSHDMLVFHTAWRAVIDAALKTPEPK